jgi:acetamidase/formamidase
MHLPVGVEGGYLYLGDVHAVQGDGEITGNGIEVSSEVTFSVQVNHFDLAWPAGEDAEYLFTIGNARPYEQAFRTATMQMAAWLQRGYGMDPNQVGLLLGQLVHYEVGNLVSNAYTGVCCFPKKYLK